MTYSEYLNKIRAIYPNFDLDFEGFESNGQMRVCLQATLGETRSNDPEIISREFVAFTCSYEEWAAKFDSDKGRINIVERLLKQLERNKSWKQELK